MAALSRPFRMEQASKGVEVLLEGEGIGGAHNLIEGPGSIASSGYRRQLGNTIGMEPQTAGSQAWFRRPGKGTTRTKRPAIDPGLSTGQVG